MEFLANPIQENFVLENIINSSSSEKYNINCLYEIKIKEFDIDNFTESIINVFNNQLLLNTIPKVSGSNVFMKHSQNLSRKDIEIEIIDQYRSVDELKKDKIFEYVFSLDNDKLLYKLKIVISKNGVFLLTNFHHIVFDFWSGMSLYQQVLEYYYDKKLLPIEKQEKMYLRTLQKFKESQKKSKAINFYTNMFKQKDFDNSVIKYSEKKKTYSEKLNFKLGNDSIVKSVKILKALSQTFSELNKENKLVVGVPIPNRVKINRELVTCLVSTPNLCINYEESETDIRKKLLYEMKYQFFDFAKNFPQYSKQQIIFTYYSTNLSVNIKGNKIELIELFNILPPAPIHITFDNRNILQCEIQIEDIKEMDSFYDLFLEKLKEMSMDE